MNKFIENCLPNKIALAVSAVVFTAATASAALTVDLRASSATFGTIGGGGKSVEVPIGGAGNITLQVWAQVTNASPTHAFGVNQILGSVVSSTVNQGGTTGAASVATRNAPWADPSSSTGTVGELSVGFGLPVDTIGDVGASGGTSPSTQVIFSKTGTDSSRGTQIAGGVTYVISNLNAAGATFQAIPNGFEFFMGSVTLSLANFGASTVISENWVFPTTFTLANQKNKMAQWTQADNVFRQGADALFVLPATGAAVVISAAVPEPSAFGMVLVGALGLVGFRRLGFRRS